MGGTLININGELVSIRVYYMYTCSIERYDEDFFSTSPKRI